jgi:hypothetical protein
MERHLPSICMKKFEDVLFVPSKVKDDRYYRLDIIIYYYLQCNVDFCVTSCFEVYHSKVKYQLRLHLLSL